MRLQDLKVDELQCGDVRRFEDDRGGVARFVGLLPAFDADAPAVTRLEPGKAPLRHGGRQVVARLLRVVEEVGGHFRANEVQSLIFAARVAASVPIEAGHRIGRTSLQISP